MLNHPVAVIGREAIIPSQQIQPVGLIVNELVTNAAKHGGSGITVRFQPAGHGVHSLSALDEGEVLPADFNPIGASSGLGMTLVSVLARQLQGEVTAAPNLTGRGACFTVTFPAA